MDLPETPVTVAQGLACPGLREVLADLEAVRGGEEWIEQRTVPNRGDRDGAAVRRAI
jgi:hypothetical protein